jgi:hypothetical protein
MRESLTTDYISIALPQAGDDVNEGELILGGHADFEDIDKSSGNLGRTQPSEPAKDAENQQKVAQINVEKTSVGLKIREVAWGEFEAKAAC